MTPCKGCEKRHLKCHGSCPEYLEYKRIRDKGRQAEQAGYEAHQFRYDGIIKGVKKRKLPKK